MPFSLKRRSNAFAGDAAGDKSKERKSKRKSLLGLLKGGRWRKKKKGKGEEVGCSRRKGYDDVLC